MYTRGVLFAFTEYIKYEILLHLMTHENSNSLQYELKLSTNSAVRKKEKDLKRRQQHLITLMDRYKMLVNQLLKMKINPSASGTVSPESNRWNPKLSSHSIPKDMIPSAMTHVGELES